MLISIFHLSASYTFDFTFTHWILNFLCLRECARKWVHTPSYYYELIDHFNVSFLSASFVKSQHFFSRAKVYFTAEDVCKITVHFGCGHRIQFFLVAITDIIVSISGASGSHRWNDNEPMINAWDRKMLRARTKETLRHRFRQFSIICPIYIIYFCLLVIFCSSWPHIITSCVKI